MPEISPGDRRKWLVGTDEIRLYALSLTAQPTILEGSVNIGFAYRKLFILSSAEREWLITLCRNHSISGHEISSSIRC